MKKPILNQVTEGLTLNFDVPAGQLIKLNLKATSKKMFLLSIPQIGISLMADSGKAVSKIIRFDKIRMLRSPVGAWL